MLQFFVVHCSCNIIFPLGTASKKETVLPRKLARVLILQDCLSSITAAVFLMFSFLLDVSVRVMFRVSVSKPKNVIFCVGTNIDFVKCMTNANSSNMDIVASTSSKHS